MAKDAAHGRALRALQLVQRPQRRGAEVFAYELSEEFERRGVRTRILYLYPFEGEAGLSLRPGDRCLDGRDAHPFEFVPGIHPGLLRRLNEALDAFAPDIVQANGGRTLKYAASARRTASSWKLVYRNIGLPSDWHRSRASIAAYRLAFIPRLDAVISVCRFSLDDATRVYAPSAPTFVVPNGIDGSKLDADVDAGATRTALGCEADDFVLLFLGSLSRAKDPGRFVRVAAAAAARAPTVTAWIVGDGPLRRRLERQCRELGLADRFCFVGHQRDVGPYLRAADALVVPSATEGMPAVLLEAAYVGLPVVATRVGGIPECVVHEETGLLAETHSDDALIDEVMSLVCQPALRRQLSIRARQVARRSFTIDSVADDYLEVYGRVLRGLRVAA